MSDPNDWVTIYHKELVDASTGLPLQAEVQRKAYDVVWKLKGWRLSPPKKKSDGEG